MKTFSLNADDTVTVSESAPGKDILNNAITTYSTYTMTLAQLKQQQGEFPALPADIAAALLKV